MAMKLLPARTAPSSVAVTVDLITRQESQILLRNLVRIGFGSIAFLRGLFSEDNFRDRVIAGITVKSLTPKTDEAETIIRYLEEGVFEAMKQELVKAVVFKIIRRGADGEEDLLETYSFVISTAATGDKSDGRRCGGDEPGAGVVRNRAEVQDKIKQMLRQMVVVTQFLRPLPPDPLVQVDIVYGSATTEPLQLPFFEEAAPIEYVPPRSGVGFHLGELDTPYHSIRLALEALDVGDPLPQESPASRGHDSADSSQRRGKRTRRSSADDARLLPPEVYRALQPLKYVSMQVLQDRLGLTRAESGRLLAILERKRLIGPELVRFGHPVLLSSQELQSLIEQASAKTPSGSATSATESSDVASPPTSKRHRVTAPSPRSCFAMVPPAASIDRQRIWH